MTMQADDDARNDLAVINGYMKPYAIQINVMPGELSDMFTVGVKSLFEIDTIVFADSESELRYLALNENSIFTIDKKLLQKTAQ